MRERAGASAGVAGRMASGITHVRCACVGDLGASRRVGFDDPMRMMVGDRADWVGRARGAKGAGEAMGARVSPASGSCGQPLDDWNGRARFSTFLLILARDSRPRRNTHGSNRCAFASRPYILQRSCASHAAA